MALLIAFIIITFFVTFIIIIEVVHITIIIASRSGDTTIKIVIVVRVALKISVIIIQIIFAIYHTGSSDNRGTFCSSRCEFSGVAITYCLTFVNSFEPALGHRTLEHSLQCIDELSLTPNELVHHILYVADFVRGCFSHKIFYLSTIHISPTLLFRRHRCTSLMSSIIKWIIHEVACNLAIIRCFAHTFITTLTRTI